MTTLFLRTELKHFERQQLCAVFIFLVNKCTQALKTFLCTQMAVVSDTKRFGCAVAVQCDFKEHTTSYLINSCSFHLLMAASLGDVHVAKSEKE